MYRMYAATFQHVKKKLSTVSFCNVFVTFHSVFQQRNIVRQTDDKVSNRTFFRTQLISRSLKFKSSNQSFKTDMAHTVLFFGSDRVDPLLFHQRLRHPRLCAVSLPPLHCFPPFFSFFDQWQQLRLLLWSRIQISWRRNQICWVDKWPYYLRSQDSRVQSATKYVNQRQKGHFPWQQSNMLSNGQLHENNWPPNVGKAHSSEWSSLQH